MNETGRRLRKLRTDSDISQKELAKYTGLSAQIISNIERGYTGISSEQAAKLAKYFHVSTDYLLDSPEPVLPDVFVLSDDEQRLIHAYRELSEDYRDIVMGEAKKALLAQRREKNGQ